MAENLMDIKQVAEYLQMNKMTVYKLAREARIPAFKVASEWRFRKDLIDEWLLGKIKDSSGAQKISLEKKQGGKTILVVDDEKVIQDFFTRVLTEYRVLTASDGREALDIISRENPDLVLLDIRMPGIDGIETLRQIKKIDENIAVIMLSAYETLRTNMEAARLGAFASMAKPFDLDEIKKMIKSALASTPIANESKAHDSTGGAQGSSGTSM